MHNKFSSHQDLNFFTVAYKPNWIPLCCPASFCFISKKSLLSLAMWWVAAETTHHEFVEGTTTIASEFIIIISLDFLGHFSLGQFAFRRPRFQQLKHAFGCLWFEWLWFLLCLFGHCRLNLFCLRWKDGLDVEVECWNWKNGLFTPKK